LRAPTGPPYWEVLLEECALISAKRENVTEKQRTGAPAASETGKRPGTGRREQQPAERRAEKEKIALIVKSGRVPPPITATRLTEIWTDYLVGQTASVRAKVLMVAKTPDEYSAHMLSLDAAPSPLFGNEPGEAEWAVLCFFDEAQDVQVGQIVHVFGICNRRTEKAVHLVNCAIVR
jgi:hypothetical protein